MYEYGTEQRDDPYESYILKPEEAGKLYEKAVKSSYHTVVRHSDERE